MEKTKQKSQHVILAKARIQFVRSCEASNKILRINPMTAKTTKTVLGQNQFFGTNGVFKPFRSFAMLSNV